MGNKTSGPSSPNTPLCETMGNSQQPSCHMESTQRQALGRAASLGALYDVRNDCFCPGSVFSGTLPPSCITCQDTPSSKIDIVSDETYSTTFKNHNIEGELKLSVMCGLVGLQGSGKYFENVKQSSRSVKVTLAYCVCTKYEKINIDDTLLRQSVSTDALNTTEATHFVSEIQWGANAFASLEYRNTENDSKSNLEGKLSGSLKTIKKNIDPNRKGQVEEEDMDTATRSTLKIIGDVIPRNQKVPETLEEARNWLAEIPENIESYDDGKGVPLMLKLCPLREVAQLVNVQLNVDRIVSRVDASCMQQWEHKLDGMVSAKQEFNDLWEDVHSLAGVCVPDADKEELTQLKTCMEDYESSFQAAMKKSLLSLRSGREHPDKLISDSENKVRAFLAGKEKLLKMMSWVKQLQRQDIRFVKGCGRANEFRESISLEHGEKSVYVLLYCTESRGGESWEKNIGLFYKLKREHEDSKSGQTNCLFCVVELEERDQMVTAVPSDLSTPDGLSRILHFENGRLVCKDVLADRSRISMLSLVKSSSQHAEIWVHLPNSRKALTIRCPGSFHGRCPNDVREWSCERCLKHMEFEWDGYFYCHCGRFPVNDCSFKCCSDVHGPSFEAFGTTDILHKLLEEMRRKINILILGATGVGKSTWINAFANYIMYRSIKEALSAEELVSLIPTSFTTEDTDFVAPGESGNEDHRPGQSATQSCRSYAFYIGDHCIVRLIDTPGIGDTRGRLVDDKNTEALLTFLGRYYEEIHGICVMVNASEARLTEGFEFCIRSLLCRLHTSARENIVFVFSHAKQGGAFGPGEALRPLRALLTKISEQPPHVPIACNERRNYYCVENQTFQFLVVARDGRIEYTEESIGEYSRMWDLTVRECDRLMKHVLSLPPYRIEKSLQLNVARLSILDLLHVLLELVVTIQRNVTVVKTKKAEVERLKGNMMSELENLFVMPEIRLEVDKYACVKCRCSACRDRFPVCASGVSWFFWNVWTPMFGGHCQLCGCSWLPDHEFVTWKNSVNFQQVRACNKAVHELKEAFKVKVVLAGLEHEVNDWQQDLRTLTRIVAKLAVFVKKNAITGHDLIEFPSLVKKKRQATNEAEVILAFDILLQVYQEEVREAATAQEDVRETSSSLPTLLKGLEVLKKVDGSKFMMSDAEKASWHEILKLPASQETTTCVLHSSLPVLA